MYTHNIKAAGYPKYLTDLLYFLGNVLQDEEHAYISVPLFTIYTILSISGIIFVAICLVFNLWFRNQKYVLYAATYILSLV